MSVLDDAEDRERAEAEAAKRARLERKQFRADVQAVLATPGGRRVVHAFLRDAGLDASPYRGSASDMGHAVGWQDAARWWVDAIRAHCPEREALMRAEAKQQDQESSDE